MSTTDSDEPTKEAQLYRKGAIVWVRATVVTSNAELHRRFGSYAKKTWANKKMAKDKKDMRGVFT